MGLNEYILKIESSKCEELKTLASGCIWVVGEIIVM